MRRTDLEIASARLAAPSRTAALHPGDGLVLRCYEVVSVWPRPLLQPPPELRSDQKQHQNVPEGAAGRTVKARGCEGRGLAEAVLDRLAPVLQTGARQAFR